MWYCLSSNPLGRLPVQKVDLPAPVVRPGGIRPYGGCGGGVGRFRQDAPSRRKFRQIGAALTVFHCFYENLWYTIICKKLFFASHGMGGGICHARKGPFVRYAARLRAGFPRAVLSRMKLFVGGYAIYRQPMT